VALRDATASRVAVIGAGAVGASIAAMIHEAGMPVTLLANPARAESLRVNGLSVNGRRYDLPVDGGDGSTYDLILVATKWIHLRQALPLIASAAGTGGYVMSLLNGIRSEGAIADAGLRGRVIPAMILGIDAVREDRRVTYLNRGTIHFGSAPPEFPVPDRVLDAVASYFAAAGIPCDRSPDITRTLWWKLIINVGINQCSCVLRATYGLFQRSDPARRLMTDAMREVVAISRAEGTGLSDEDIDAWHETLGGLDPEGKTSMLQDVEAGRPTEVELFAGTVCDIADRHSVDVPVNRTLYRIIRAIEER